MTREQKIAHALRAVDELDLRHLEAWLPDSGHGRFWKAVVMELRAAIGADEPNPFAGLPERLRPTGGQS